MNQTEYRLRNRRKQARHVYRTLDRVHRYAARKYGFDPSLSGNDVCIGMVDTGLPDHRDIPNIGDASDVTERGRRTSKKVFDRHGHATMVTGVINADGKYVKGIAPKAELIHANAADNKGRCSYRAVLAGVLWCIVKQCDVILVSLGSQNHHSVLQDAMRKAVQDEGIAVVAASGDVDPPDYPARYDEVLGVGTHRDPSPDSMRLRLPSDPYTTYLNNAYTRASGPSMAAALAAGLAALAVEDARKRGRSTAPVSIYDELRTRAGGRNHA